MSCSKRRGGFGFKNSFKGSKVQGSFAIPVVTEKPLTCPILQLALTTFPDSSPTCMRERSYSLVLSSAIWVGFCLSPVVAPALGPIVPPTCAC